MSRATRAHEWILDCQDELARGTTMAALGGACWLADFAACARTGRYHLHAYGRHLCTALALREAGAVALDLVRLAPLRQRLTHLKYGRYLSSAAERARRSVQLLDGVSRRLLHP